MFRTPYVRRLRNRQEHRVRHSEILLAWLAVQAERLSTSITTIFNLLRGGMSARQVEDLEGEYPTNTVAPELTGTPKVSETLTVTNGTWTPSEGVTFERTWLRDGTPIEGASGTTYEVTEDDVDATIVVIVDATNDLGTVSAASNELGPVEGEEEQE